MEHARSDRDERREEVDVPTAEETGTGPRPSQAEGDRETIEQDLADQTPEVLPED